MKIYINNLLSKFDNGFELYDKNTIFRNCVEQLLRGGDIYKILEQIIVIHQKEQEHYQEFFSSGIIRQEIIVSKTNFDELILNK